MADTVLTELKMHVFDTAEQLSQYESEIGENDLAFTLDDKLSADIDLMNITDGAKELMANASMPSGTYIDLTLGSSGATYTAPADGWLMLRKKSSGSGQYIAFENIASSLVGKSISTTTQELAAFVPVKAGDEITVTYNAGGDTNKFRFVYSVGSEHLA